MAIINGTNRADRLFGGNADDLIFGFGGNDEIRGGDGNDVLHGGAGNDFISVDANFFNNHTRPDFRPAGYFDYSYGWSGNNTLEGGDGWYCAMNGNGDNNSRNDVKGSDDVRIHAQGGRPYQKTALLADFDTDRDRNPANDEIRFLSTPDSQVRVLSWERGARRPDADGDGWSAPVVSATFGGAHGERVKVIPEQQFGIVMAHTDGGQAELYADILDIFGF